MSRRPGSYRILMRSRRAVEDQLAPELAAVRRAERMLASLLDELRSGSTVVRARCIFREPREIFRLEIANSERGYQRTTLLDREVLEELLEHDGVRDRLALE
jgi:hypothetical protein